MAEKKLNVVDIKDERVFKRIFEENFDFLSRYANSVLKNNQLAEDIVEDFFISLWEKRDTIVFKKNYKSYFLRSIHNRCLDQLNRKATKLEYRIESFARPDDLKLTSKFYENSNSIDTEEIRKMIDDAVKSLPEACQKIFIMSRFQDLKYKEIANELNISVNTVEMQMSRALKKLRVKLRDYITIFFW